MSKSIFRKDEADLIAISYAPKKFPQVVTSAASHFVSMQNSEGEQRLNSGFRIDRIVAEQTGVAELERLSMEEKVELQALARLKDLQEDAYAQAYAIGQDEGRENAFNAYREQFADKLSRFDEILSSMANLKSELVNSNEGQIVKLVYYLARRVALTEIAERPELILNAVNQAVRGAQSEENINVRVSSADFEFIESARERLGKEFIALKNVTFEATPEVSQGGCIVRTNYGEVNATVEQRLEKLWTALSEKIPNTKDSVGK